MCQAIVKHVASFRRHNLCNSGEASKRSAIQDDVAIVLRIGAVIARFLGRVYDSERTGRVNHLEPVINFAPISPMESVMLPANWAGSIKAFMRSHAELRKKCVLRPLRGSPGRTILLKVNNRL